MRPIEFRGWAKDQNWPKERSRWVFGDYEYSEKGKYPEMYCVYGYEVIPESIGQFIGMTDGNGVKIFGAVGGKGGDLVKKYNAIFSVEYIGAEWVLKSIAKPDFCIPFAACDMSDIIIVGNAYEGVKK